MQATTEGDAYFDVRSASLLARTKLPYMRSWNLSPAYTHFAGRDQELAKLEVVLQKQRQGVISQNIVGLGGIGKSTLAKQYAHKALVASTYDFVFWVNANNYTSLLNDFQQLAFAFGMPPRQIQHFKTAAIIQYVYDNFARYSKVLLIFDDASNQAILQDKEKVDNGGGEGNFLPPSRAANLIHWLVTTRNQNFSEDRSINILLAQFTPEEASNYIKKRLLSLVVSDSDAALLASTLHYFPLALSQALAYINVKRIVIRGNITSNSKSYWI